MPDSRPAALVTGGAKRVGRAIVTHLAESGFAVVIHANSSLDEAQQLADDLSARGYEAHAVQADLTDAQATRALMGAARDKAGPLHLLVNNASVFEDDHVTDIDDELWDTHFAVHLKAPSLLAAALHEQIPDGETGLVVNMIDQRVWKLTPQFYSYTLSKAALWTATQTMAQALAPRTRVNAIGPGPTLKNARQDDEDFSRQTDALPLKTGPELTEFGATILHFWNARSITGQMLALDGGQHLAWKTPDVAGVRE